MDFKICGRVQLRSDGAWHAEWLNSKKARGMLGVLLTRPRTVFPVGILREWLWGPDAGSIQQIKPTLQSHVSKIRTSLENLGIDARLEHVNSGYRLDAAPDQVDLHRAKQLLTDAHAAIQKSEYEQACENLTAALTMVREPPLLELETGPAAEFRQRTERNIVLPSHYALLKSRLRIGQPELVLATLDDLQPEHELNTTLAKRRLDAFWATGRFDEATEYHLRVRRRLRDGDLFEEADDLLAYFNQNRPSIPTPRRPLEEAPDYRVKPRRFPTGHDHLTGREALLSELDSVTDHGRRTALVVLTGTAGIGKTALAVHWARSVRKHFPDGHICLDLRGFSDYPRLECGDVVRRLLQLFHSSADRLAEETAQLERLADIIGDRRLLLIFDNVESAEQITPLLDTSPDSLIVVTSRHHLTEFSLHHGATEINVPTVSPDATRQWMRAAIGPRCHQEPAAVNALVEMCAGIPFVFRLVSQYAKERPGSSLREIARILRDEHWLLDVGESADRAAGTIRASFGLSYRALPTEPRRAFRLIGLHPVPIMSLGAAVALVGGPLDAARKDLDTLVHANLVEQTTGHFALHDLLHEFAAEQAQTDESTITQDAALVRILDWYLYTAKNAEKAMFPYSPGVPDLEHECQIQAEEFVDDQAAFNWYVEEQAAMIAAVHLAYRRGQHAHSWRLANHLKEPLKRMGAYHSALDCLKLGLSSAEATEDRQGISGTLNNLGYICMSMNKFKDAHAYFTSAYELFREIEHAEGTAIALHNLAYQRFRTNDLDAAWQLFNEALNFEHEHGLDQARAGTLRHLGLLWKARGDLVRANVTLHRALELFESLEQAGAPQSGRVLSDISQLYLDRGDTRAAIDYGERALALHSRSHDLASFGETCLALTTAYSRQGHQRAAVECARESIRICWRTGDADTEARALELLSRELEASGQSEAASEGRARAAELRRDTGNETSSPT
ncbi:AfsR/SARP family transcriptional regulator [Saccharopolyspora elongata]|uniref:Tetratricopeptide repeat protein n=1 Tax=Saccharopolyspora elongata TaxID=2530387 RepID=A0A4R4XZM7_9PSEU|nr:tetratricopeptide repeat protein [Saccharopolyspora elongata]TDD37185.1 tetratricopeptide repeat protein [Saccharopolyspora elongata]